MNRESRRNRRKLVEIWKFRPAWMRVVAGLAAVVMFVTVYSLILPAAAATGDQATEESGFFLEESAAETETKELAEAEPASGGEAAQEAESPSGSSEEGSTVQQESGSGSGESGSSAQPETLQAETSGSGSGWESIPQDSAVAVEAANTDNSGSTASGSGQNGTEEFVVSEQEANKSTEAATTVTEETVSETASQKTEATTEEITEETSEELSEETEEEEEEPVYTDTIETEDEKTGIKAKIVFDEEIVRDTDKLVLAAASDKKSDKEIVIPLEALEKGIAERCAEIVSKDLDDEEKKSADDIETVKAEFVGLTIEDKDGEEVSLPANTRMRVEIVFPGSYETEEEEYQCVLMAEQSAKDYQDQLEKKAADDELVVSMEKLKADISEQDQANGGKTVVSFETKELNSAGIVVFRVSEEDVEEASSDESEVSEESSETSSEEISDETAETSEDVTDESSDEISESKETVSEDALAKVPAESTDEVTSETSSESEEAASEEDTTVYEAGMLKADGSDYHITMTYAEDAKIPAGARLEVRELQERTREFNKLIGQYNKEFPDAKIETESSSAVVRGLKKATDAVTGFVGGLFGIEKAPEPTSVQTARLFDITILDENGKEIEPSGTVQVDIQLDALQQVAKESDVTLVHFEDKVNEVDASLSGETLSFETDSFSVYGVMYAVDFEYQGGKFSMPGNQYMALADLLAKLSINVSNDQIIDADFDDPSLVRVYVTDSDIAYESLIAYEEDSDEPLRAVAEAEGDYIEAENKYETVVISKGTWVLESIAPFDTQQILTVKTSGETYTIKVSDAQNADGTWHLDDEGVTTSFSVSTESQTNEISHSASLDLDFAYALSQSTLAEMKAAVNAGQAITITYDASSALGNKASAIDVSDGSLMVGRRKVGSYSIHGGKLTLMITATDWLLGRTNLSGTFGFSIKMDEQATKNDEKEKFEFPGAGDIEVTFKKKTEEGTKNLDAVQNPDGSWTLNYTASIQVNQELDDLSFNDVLGGLQKLNANSVKIDGNSVNISQTASGFTISSADFKSAISNTKVPAKTYRVTYSTTVSAEDLKHDEAGVTNETNTASWIVNGKVEDTVPGGHTEKEIPYITPPTPDITKSSDPASGTALSTDGQTINYTISVGDADHTLNALNVVDNMTDLQTLEGDITITYADGTSETMPSSAVKWINDASFSANTAQVFDYTFTSTKNGPATITYTTKAITQAQAKEAGIFGTQTIVNNAGEYSGGRIPPIRDRIPANRAMIPKSF